MTDHLLKRYQEELDTLEQRNLKRELSSISGVDFTSNDFLGLTHADSIRQAVQKALGSGVPLGAGGSRLLRGNYDAHQHLEEIAAKFFGAEKALFLSNGYSANVALFTTLPKKGDLIVFDALSHASIREGVFNSPAKSVKAKHNDPQAIERAIIRWRENSNPSAVPWIAIESLYSMDGDMAPLDELIEIADSHEAMLVVDEAHATGVFGPNGCGLTEPHQGRSNLIVLHTCGKALGVSGALICASSLIIDYMITRCRPFIYSTAPSPIVTAAVAASLKLVSSEPERRQKLRELVEVANSELNQRFGISGSGSQIIPFLIGDEKITGQIAKQMQDAGFDLRAIRPPTVPAGTSRLRISITLNVTERDIREMFAKLYAITQHLNIKPMQL